MASKYLKNENGIVKAITTNNLGLEKPLLNENYDIEVHNRNMDKIDNAIQEVKGQVSGLELKAEKVSIADEEGLFEATNVEDALLENKTSILELQNADGDLKQLQTTNKANLVGAINELFQNANNGKSTIATAIGSPLSSGDTFSAMGTKIDTLTQKLRTNLNAKGVSTSASEKMSPLIDKVTDIKTGSDLSKVKGYSFEVVNSTPPATNGYRALFFSKNKLYVAPYSNGVPGFLYDISTCTPGEVSAQRVATNQLQIYSEKYANTDYVLCRDFRSQILKKVLLPSFTFTTVANTESFSNKCYTTHGNYAYEFILDTSSAGVLRIQKYNLDNGTGTTALSTPVPNGTRYPSVISDGTYMFLLCYDSGSKNVCVYKYNISQNKIELVFNASMADNLGSTFSYRSTEPFYNLAYNEDTGIIIASSSLNMFSYNTNTNKIKFEGVGGVDGDICGYDKSSLYAMKSLSDAPCPIIRIGK